jgi:hypothetical protein
MARIASVCKQAPYPYPYPYPYPQLSNERTCSMARIASVASRCPQPPNTRRRSWLGLGR